MFFRPAKKRSQRPNRQPAGDVNGNVAARLPNKAVPTANDPAKKNPRRSGHCAGCPAHDSEMIGGVVYHWCLVSHGTEPMAYWFRRIHDEWSMKDCRKWGQVVAQLAIDTDRQIELLAELFDEQETIKQEIKEDADHESRTVRRDTPAAARPDTPNGGGQRKRILRIRGRQIPQFQASGTDEPPF